jgi:hypothetical protein
VDHTVSGGSVRRISLAWRSSVGMLLRLELTKRGAKPAGPSSCRVAVNQTTKLAHGATRIVETMLVQVHQGQSHTKVIAPGELVCAEGIELDRCRSRLLERAGQQGGSPQRSLDPLGGVSGSLAIRVCSSLMVASHLECLYRGVPTAYLHQADVDEEVEQSIDHRLEHTGQEANREAVDRPQRHHQIEHPRISGDDRKNHRQYGAEQRDSADSHSHQAERLFGPGFTGAGFLRCLFGHGMEGGRSPRKAREPRRGQQATRPVRLG